MNYYNENNEFCAEWLRNLIAGGLIPPGEIDTRSIVEVQPSDLRGFTQCHFFCGISGWPLALDLAGWGDRPVWTGSCPCQPFSAAGKRGGTSDPRHLWPEFLRLISQCNPPVVIGEQVASKDGRGWLNGVRTDLEALGYGVGGADLCAAGVGAPHIRQRIYWVADLHNQGLERAEREELQGGGCGFTESSILVGLGNTNLPRPQGWGEHVGEYSSECVAGETGATLRMGNPLHPEWRENDGPLQNDLNGNDSGREEAHGKSGASGEVCWLAHTSGNGRGQINQDARRGNERNTEEGRAAGFGLCGPLGSWGNFDIVHCTDNKSRRIESGTFPLVAGFPKGMVRSGDQSAPINANSTPEARVMRLRGYGNAIVPSIAAEFIAAYMETAV